MKLRYLAGFLLLAFTIVTGCSNGSSGNSTPTSPPPEETGRGARAPPPGGLTVGPVDCAGGTAGDFNCSGVSLRKRVANSDMGGGDGNDIWGWVDSASGNEYALMGLTNGTAFVDVSDPENPVFLGHIATNTVEAAWRDIKVY